MNSVGEATLKLQLVMLQLVEECSNVAFYRATLLVSGKNSLLLEMLLQRPHM